MNETTIRPGPLANVAVRSAGDRWTLIFSRDLRHPPKKVWAALTDPDQLARWAPFLASRDLTITGDATLTMVDGDVRQDLPATVTRSEPHTLLEYTWGTDDLRWELAAIGVDPGDGAMPPDPSGNRAGSPTAASSTAASSTTASIGTRLTLRHAVSGRDWIPKAAAGWHLCLLVAERLLDGQPIDPIRGRAALNHGWDDLNRAYAGELGIPATGLPETRT